RPTVPAPTRTASPRCSAPAAWQGRRRENRARHRPRRAGRLEEEVRSFPRQHRCERDQAEWPSPDIPATRRSGASDAWYGDGRPARLRPSSVLWLQEVRPPIGSFLHPYHSSSTSLHPYHSSSTSTSPASTLTTKL